MPIMIVTMDGPAGSGKSTVARQLALRLGIAYLDTGAMYRTVGLAAARQSVPLDVPDQVRAMLVQLDMDIRCTPSETLVRLNGRDVGSEIRTMFAARAAGAVAVIEPIRHYLIDRQRSIAAELGSLVADGRDQGSVVFPNADAKFLITASPECRARRRFEELCAEGQSATIDEVRADLLRRDTTDELQWRLLLEPGIAIRVDTTDLSLDQVVVRVLQHLGDRV